MRTQVGILQEMEKHHVISQVEGMQLTLSRGNYGFHHISLQ